MNHHPSRPAEAACSPSPFPAVPPVAALFRGCSDTARDDLALGLRGEL